MYESRLELLLVRAHEEGPPSSGEPWLALAQDFAWVHRVGQQEALPTAVAGAFDCALVETVGEQGLELVTALRQNTPHLPIVVLARIDDLALHRQALRLGAQDVLLHDCLQSRTTLRSIEFAIERQRMWASLSQAATADSTREEEAKRRAQAERLSDLGRLTGGIAHEINNPVALLAANLEFLHDRLGTPERDCERVVALEARRPLPEASLVELFEDCREAIHRISAIVSDLRACAHVADDDLEAVDLREIVEAACAALPDAEHSDTVIIKHLHAVPPLLGHRGKLTQVAIALLSNALEAALPCNSGSGHVVVSTRAEPKHVVLAVEDNGFGLSEELRERIFDPFFHGSSRDGRGLGLALASEIIRGHRGEIRVETEAGIGSRFEVHIPIAEVPRIAPAPLRPLRARSTRKPKVLLIDDEPAFLRALARLLRHDYIVSIASSGAEALELKPECHDVIICDLMMPQMDGPTFFGQVVKRAPEVRSRFVFVTGGAFEEGVRRFIEQVRNPVLQKPFTARELADVIERLLGTSRPTTQVTTVAS